MTPQSVLNRRASVEKWKVKNREYYLQQKRELAARPEYRAKCRARYREKRDALKEAGLLPVKLGRPVLYEGQEAIDRRRQGAREASARYRRRRKFSQAKENHESTPSQRTGETTDRSGDSSGSPSQSASIRCGARSASGDTLSDDL